MNTILHRLRLRRLLEIRQWTDPGGIDDRGTGLRSLGSDAIRSIVLGPTRIALRGRIVLVVNDITPEGRQSQWIAAIDGHPESTRYALRSFRSRPTCTLCRPSHCTPDRPSRCGPILPVTVPMPHCSAGRADSLSAQATASASVRATVRPVARRRCRFGRRCRTRRCLSPDRPASASGHPASADPVRSCPLVEGVVVHGVSS